MRRAKKKGNLFLMEKLAQGAGFSGAIADPGASPPGAPNDFEKTLKKALTGKPGGLESGAVMRVGALAMRKFRLISFLYFFS